MRGKRRHVIRADNDSQEKSGNRERGRIIVRESERRESV